MRITVLLCNTFARYFIPSSPILFNRIFNVNSVYYDTEENNCIDPNKLLDKSITLLFCNR